MKFLKQLLESTNANPTQLNVGDVFTFRGGGKFIVTAVDHGKQIVTAEGIFMDEDEDETYSFKYSLDGHMIDLIDLQDDEIGIPEFLNNILTDEEIVRLLLNTIKEDPDDQGIRNLVMFALTKLKKYRKSIPHLDVIERYLKDGDHR